MKFNQFILKLMLFNYRKYLSYFFCISFSMAVFFLFSAIWFVPDFSEQTSSGTKQIIIIGGIISIAFSIFLITYSYNHFFKSKTKELGILMSYGLLFSDIKKMIIIENTIVYLGAFISAFISGSVFARLFFLLTTTILGIEEVSFSLTYKSFLLTAVSFIPLYLLMVVITIFKIKKLSVTSMIKVNKVKEIRRQGSKVLAVVGLLVMMGSITFLYVYTNDFSHADHMKKAILLSISSLLVGVFLFISTFSSLLYAFWKKNEKAYFKNILPLSEFASRFSQNRSIILMVCLLSIGIVFFTTLTYTLYNQSYEIAENEQYFDCLIKDYQSIQLAKELDIDGALNKAGSNVKQSQKLNVVYLEAPEMNHTSWRTNMRVMVTSVKNYNAVFSAKQKVEMGKAKVIDFNSEQSELDYFTKEISLNDGQQTSSFITQGTERVKLFDRYVFSQPVLILLNETEFNQIAQGASSSEVGSIYLFKFKDWQKSKKFVESLEGQMETALTKLGKSNREAVATITSQYNTPFIVHSKYNRYVHVKQVASFSLFIMSFISLLFIVTICVVLYFKTFTDQEEDRLKIKMLRTVGITSSEIKKYLSSKLKMVIVLPVILGGGLGLCLSVAINLPNAIEMEISNSIIFTNGLIVVGLYFGLIVFYYYWLKNKYQKVMV